MRAQKETVIDLPDLRLHGDFDCTAAPVQASGMLGQHRFYFRARHDTWRFAVALHTDIDPVDIDSSEQGFLREQHYAGHGSGASYMALDEARQIIRECATEFLRTHAP